MFALLAAFCFAVLCTRPPDADVWFHAALSLWALHFAFAVGLPRFKGRE